LSGERLVDFSIRLHHPRLRHPYGGDGLRVRVRRHDFWQLAELVVCFWLCGLRNFYFLLVHRDLELSIRLHHR